MSKICVHVPKDTLEHTIDLVITVDGRERLANYRVESVEWPSELPTAERINHLRDYIDGYEAGWDLVQIGPAAGARVPVTFRKKVN